MVFRIIVKGSQSYLGLVPKGVEGLKTGTWGHLFDGVHHMIRFAKAPFRIESGSNLG